MVTTIDIGNTNLHLGRFHRRRLVRVLTLASTGRIAWNQIRSFIRHDPERAVVIASVQPRLDQRFQKMVQNLTGQPARLVNHRRPAGLKIGYRNPRTLGADRIVNAAGALALFNRPAIVISMGTAVTVDVVMKNGFFAGGYILPGPALMAAALHRHTARLPAVRLTSARYEIGRSTRECLRAGIVLGTAAAIRNLIHAVRARFPQHFLVLATGGQARLIAPFVPEIKYVIPHLSLYGLHQHYLIYG